MVGFFKVIGGLSVAAAIAYGLMWVRITEGLSLLGGFMGIVTGLALIALARCMQRIAFLQEQLNLYMPEQKPDDTP